MRQPNVVFEKKFKPIELTVDERFKMLREGAAVAGLEFFQPLACERHPLPRAPRQIVSFTANSRRGSIWASSLL